MQIQQQWKEPIDTGNPIMSRTEPTLDIPRQPRASLSESEAPPAETIAQPEQPTESTNPEPAPAPVDVEPDSKSTESELKEKLASAEAKAAEMQEAFMRAKAEVENFRRRAQDDVTRAHKFAIDGFAESLVPVKDSRERALKIETPSLQSIKEGVEMTLKQLNTAFEKNRLTEICPKPGEKLDPMKHQAISMVPVEQNPNTIISVLQKGYMIADRLLRPALVTVAQAKQDQNQA